MVEDNDLNLAVITKFLEMSGVTQIDTASDGAAGAEALFVNTYDFVLTDIHMPVMSGLDMIRTVVVRCRDFYDFELRARMHSRTLVGEMTGQTHITKNASLSTDSAPLLALFSYLLAQTRAARDDGLHARLGKAYIVVLTGSVLGESELQVRVGARFFLGVRLEVND